MNRISIAHLTAVILLAGLTTAVEGQEPQQTLTGRCQVDNTTGKLTGYCLTMNGQCTLTESSQCPAEKRVKSFKVDLCSGHPTYYAKRVCTTGQ